MISHKKPSNAVVGKIARACDNCIKKRARWYCRADDAFLCQSCDGSVHSANPLAQRHERVPLKTSAVPHDLMIVHAHRMKKSKESSSSAPGSWHKVFTKKPRTPRNGNGRDRKAGGSPLGNLLPLVPDVGGDETSNEEINLDEFLRYRVPAYDQSFAADLCNSKEGDLTVNHFAGEIESINSINREKGSGVDHLNNLQGFLPSDEDLAGFADDVESLLGRGLDNESFGIEELGWMDCKVYTGDAKECSLSSSGQAGVKLEEEEGGIEDKASGGQIDISSDTFKLSFDCDSPDTCCDDEDKGAIELENAHDIKLADDWGNTNDANKKRKMILRLDYEGVITAWASQGSPGTTGDRPEFNPNNCWREWMGLCGPESQNGRFGDGSLYGRWHTGIGDAGREAKVSRYREKRRTRLFSKKIRYEVRKLNAEKRPRMRGRFVKRVSFAPPSLPLLIKLKSDAMKMLFF